MGYRLRMFERRTIYFITSRTHQARFALRPSKELNAILAGVLGRCLWRYPSIKLHFFLGMSNHIHMGISTSDPAAISAFAREFFGQVADRINRHLGREGRLWSRRYTCTPCVDDGAALDRLLYTLLNPVRALLVPTVAEWPGLSTFHEAMGGGGRKGRWLDYGAMRAAMRRGERVKERDHEIEYSIDVHPLPALEGLEPAARAAFLRERIELGEREIAAEAKASGRRFLGARAVAQVNPEARPAAPKRSPEPLCHATTRDGFRDFRDRYRAFCEQYRRAAGVIRSAVYAEPFPPFATLPPYCNEQPSVRNHPPPER